MWIFLNISFLMWTILKVLMNWLRCWFCFVFWFLGLEAVRNLASQSGIKPTTPALEGEFLTTGPTEKSPNCGFLKDMVKTNYRH